MLGPPDDGTLEALAADLRSARQGLLAESARLAERQRDLEQGIDAARSLLRKLRVQAPSDRAADAGGFTRASDGAGSDGGS